LKLHLLHFYCSLFVKEFFSSSMRNLSSK
jgi:hypothetical protein